MLVAFNARSDANAFCRALIANDRNIDAGKLFKDLTHFHSLEKKCLVFAHTSKLIWSDVTKMHMMQHQLQKSTTT